MKQSVAAKSHTVNNLGAFFFRNIIEMKMIKAEIIDKKRYSTINSMWRYFILFMWIFDN